MTRYFLGCLLLYLLITLVVNFFQNEDQPRRMSFISIGIQAPLFLLALYLAFDLEAISRELVSFPRIAVGIVAGHFIFALSVILTQGSISAALYHCLDFRAVVHFLGENPLLILRFLVVSMTEELIYRAAAQPVIIEYLGGAVLGIGAVALIFSITHWHFFRNPPLQSLEFVLFALLLGGVYYGTGSLILVVTIHAVRNLEIVYLEYEAHTAELGSAEAAQDKIDEMYTRRVVQSV